MKTIRLLVPLLAVCSFAIYYGCKKSDTPGTNNPPVEYVTASVEGRVTDDNGLPVEGAVVKSGTSTTTTGIDGNFIINDVLLNKNAGLVTVEKDGFFQGSRTIVVNKDGVNTINIRLIKKTTAGNFNSTSGGEITVPTGGSIDFSANAVINEASNTTYTGTVTVSAYFINPEAGNFSEIMPGALRGINGDNEETGLQSFGMMAVELNGAGGEKLQLAPSKTALITFPIPASLQAQAPVSIPLWTFDDSSGLWKREGTAARQGNNYVGTVSHFSYWNCDAPFSIIDFSATFKDQEDNPLAGLRVEIKNPGDSTSLFGFGYTDTKGIASGKIPANKNLVLSVYNICGSLLHSQTFTTTGSSKDLGVIPIDNILQQTLVINGSAITCNGAPVNNGVASLQLEGRNYRAEIINGDFSFTVTRCNSNTVPAVITAIDPENTEQGTKEIEVTSGTAGAGQINACGTQLDEYINYALDGVPHSFVSPADTISFYSENASHTIYALLKTGDQRRLGMSFNATATGTTSLNWLYIQNNNAQYIKNGTINMNITEFGAPGSGHIAGNFTANLKDSLNASVVMPVSISFRLKRD